MNNSIQASPSANAGVQQSKTSTLESADDAASNDESGDFSTALASMESEAGGAEQQLSDNSSQPTQELATRELAMQELVTQEQFIDGNTLPAEEQVAMWQALMLMQPVDAEVSQSVSPQLQSMDLLNSQRKPILNPSQLNPSQLNSNYFNTMIMQNKDAAGSLPAGFATNNINMQLAAAQFNPETNEGILFNLTEQISPTQNASSTLTQSLAAVGLGTATQAASTQTQMAPLSLGQNAWESNLGSRLQMMVGQNIQTAEIRLDPPELGELNIKIKVANDVATVNITSPHTQVREALETAIPRLREMFEESGVALGDVNVQQESFAQHENAANDETGLSSVVSELGAIDAEEQVIQKAVSNNLLDIYV